MFLNFHPFIYIYYRLEIFGLSTFESKIQKQTEPKYKCKGRDMCWTILWLHNSLDWFHLYFQRITKFSPKISMKMKEEKGWNVKFGRALVRNIPSNMRSVSWMKPLRVLYTCPNGMLFSIYHLKFDNEH